MPIISPLRWAGWLLKVSCLLVPASELAPPNQAGTLVVRRGGTFSGHYRSTDSHVPCIRIDTHEPVTLLNCRIEGAGTLIEATAGGAQLTVRGCTGVGLPPTVDNQQRGRFLEINSAHSLTVENNLLRQTSGISVYLWSGDGTPAQTLRVRRNVVRNIDGRYRNGGGQFVNFLGLNGVRNLEGIDIAWNEIINEPNNSLVEDNINFYNSSGTAASPARVHDNYIYGAFPYPASSPSYSGSGITTDGDGNSALTTAAYIEVFRNQLVGTCAALNIPAGHDNYFHDNRVVTSRLLPDGSRLQAGYAGVAIWNAYNKPADVFFGNRLDHNVIGFVKDGMSHPYPNRHDVNADACTPCTNTEHLPNPINLSTEQHEWTLWQEKLRRNQIQLGP